MRNIFKVQRQFNLLLLLAALVLALGTGWLSQFLTGGQFEVYQKLNQPVFAPPGWVFAPVWTVLFICMGLASYRVLMYGWRWKEVRTALSFYLAQLVFNFFWTILFFGWQLRGAALAEILILLVLILLTTRAFLKRDRLAGYLMIPYAVWVAFASILNYAVWILNR